MVIAMTRTSPRAIAPEDLIASRGIPLRPDPAALVERAMVALARATITMAAAKLVKGQTEESILRDRFAGDAYTATVLRAASSPATLASSALGRSIVADLLTAIGPVGAGAQLLQAGLSFTFADGSVHVPGIEVTATSVSFVAEGAPIPVRSLVTNSVLLEPFKLSTAVVLSREMIESSNAETAVTDALTRAVGLSLDSTLFDAVTGSATRPAGLRAGIAASVASAAIDPRVAMSADLRTLCYAVSPIGGPVAIVVAPARAWTIQLLSQQPLPFTLLASPAVAINDVIAVAVQGLASATDAAPQIEASQYSAVHMETSPLPIGSPGSPATVAAPTRSLFQTDAIGVKIRFACSWALRDARALAWLTATGW